MALLKAGSSAPASSREKTGPTRGQELRVFLFLTVVLAPVLAVMIVGGYGFLVWMYQVVTGPPGAPPL
jgi:nitrate reductase NapE